MNITLARFFVVTATGQSSLNSTTGQFDQRDSSQPSKSSISWLLPELKINELIRNVDFHLRTEKMYIVRKIAQSLLKKVFVYIRIKY